MSLKIHRYFSYRYLEHYLTQRLMLSVFVPILLRLLNPNEQYASIDPMVDMLVMSKENSDEDSIKIDSNIYLKEIGQ